jgi:hypothetical protein
VRSSGAEYWAAAAEGVRYTRAAAPARLSQRRERGVEVRIVGVASWNTPVARCITRVFRAMYANGLSARHA